MISLERWAEMTYRPRCVRASWGLDEKSEWRSAQPGVVLYPGDWVAPPIRSAFNRELYRQVVKAKKLEEGRRAPAQHALTTR